MAHTPLHTKMLHLLLLLLLLIEHGEMVGCGSGKAQHFCCIGGRACNRPGCKPRLCALLEGRGKGGPQLEVSSTIFELRWRQWDLGDDGWLWQGNKERYIGGGHGKKA